MSSHLPGRPDLEFEKKQAKALLKDFRSGDASALARMRAHVPRLVESADAALADAQFVLARERGFDSWPKLKEYIESQRPLQEQIVLFMRAATGGKLAVAKRILAQRPEMAVQRLQVACAAADAANVTALLARDPTLAGKLGAGRELPLICACASHFHRIGPPVAAASVRCVRALLDHGADPNTHSVGTGTDKLPALYFACVSNNPGVVKLLLERGAKPNDGESVYHAAEMNHRECLELLVEYGADISSPGAGVGNTPLYFLADIGAQTEGVQWLLEHGANPNTPTGELAATPLHRVAASGNVAFAKLLLEHGADPNLPRKDERTPYVLAVRSGSAEVLALLRAAGARGDGLKPIDELLGACMLADEPAARAVIDKNPGIMASLTSEDQQMLHQAASSGRVEAVRLMGALGFNVAVTSNGATPLHEAAWRGRVDVVKLLVTLGAPLNVRDAQFGSSPIAWAAHGSRWCRSADEEYSTVIDALIEAGSQYAESINNSGEPPERLASPAVGAHLIARGFVPQKT
jgi:ankyrin repeat protein